MSSAESVKARLKNILYASSKLPEVWLCLTGKYALKHRKGGSGNPEQWLSKSGQVAQR